MRHTDPALHKPWLKAQPERLLVKLIMDYLKWVPGLTFKKIRGSIGMRGVLDLIICYQGKYYELEVKTPRGKLSPQQKDRIEAVRNAGGVAEVVRSLEDVHRLFGQEGRIIVDF